MLTYYVDLLVRSLMQVPTSLGSNMLGLIWPVVIVICGEIIACWVYGWRTVYDKWKKASVIGFAALGVCYTLLWIYCAVE